MAPSNSHRGVAENDPRNTGPIEYFRPRKPTPQSIRERLAPYYLSKGPDELTARVDQVMDRIARGPIRPDPPLSEPLEAVADPVYGLGTHPDIIEIMWELDDFLPKRCRWVFWGGPALVHPDTGVVFARGIGTIGFVMRLPASVLDGVDPQLASVSIRGNPGESFEIASAGPEWRFIGWKAPSQEWVCAAYEFAGEPAPPDK